MMMMMMMVLVMMMMDLNHEAFLELPSKCCEVRLLLCRQQFDCKQTLRDRKVFGVMEARDRTFHFKACFLRFDS